MMFSDHQDWPLWMGMVSLPIWFILSILSKLLCLYASVAVQKLEVLIYRDFSIQGVSSCFKAIQAYSSVFDASFFYFMRHPNFPSTEDTPLLAVRKDLPMTPLPPYTLLNSTKLQ
jgi:hypothetical protein